MVVESDDAWIPCGIVGVLALAVELHLGEADAYEAHVVGHGGELQVVVGVAHEGGEFGIGALPSGELLLGGGDVVAQLHLELVLQFALHLRGRLGVALGEEVEQRTTLVGQLSAQQVASGGVVYLFRLKGAVHIARVAVLRLGTEASHYIGIELHAHGGVREHRGEQRHLVGESVVAAPGDVAHALGATLDGYLRAHGCCRGGRGLSVGTCAEEGVVHVAPLRSRLGHTCAEGLAHGQSHIALLRQLCHLCMQLLCRWRGELLVLILLCHIERVSYLCSKGKQRAVRSGDKI